MTQLEGRFEALGDQDWIRITLDPGISYRIRLEYPSVDLGLQPRLLSVDDPPFLPGDEIRLDDIELEGPDPGVEQTVATPERGGDFYVSIKNLAGEAVPTYTVLVEEQPDDFADNALTTGLLQTDSVVSGTLEVDGDDDWIRVPVEAGVTYRMRLTLEDPFAATFSQVFSRDEDELFPVGSFPEFSPLRVENSEVIGDFTTGIEEFIFTPLTRSDYFFAISGEASAYSAELLVVEDDFADNADTVGTVAIGESVEGVIDASGDEDWVRVSLEADVTYRIVGENLEGGFSPILEAVTPDEPFPLLAEPGATPFINAPPRREFNGVDLDETSSQIVFTPARSVDYFIGVTGSLDDTGGWQVTVIEQQDDFPDHQGTTGIVPVGGSADGTIETPGDEDFFRLDLEAGQTYRIGLEGAADSFQWGSVTDGSFTPEGDLIRVGFSKSDPQDFEGAKQAIVTPNFDGEYYVAVSGGSFGETGTYTLSVAVQEDDFADNAGTSGMIEAGGTINGRIESRDDADWLRLNADADVSYRVTAESANPAEPVRLTVQTVTDDEFGLMNERDEEGSSDAFFGNSLQQTVFTPRIGGEYFIQITHGFEAQPPFDYTVSVNPIEDDYADHDETTAFLDVAARPPQIGGGLSSEQAQTVALLYEAGLDRDGNIDLPGLNFWIDAREAGLSELGLAAAFLDADEFQAAAEAFLGDGTDLTDDNVRDPSVFSDDDYVTLLYENVLDREADQGGLEFWLSVLGTLQDNSSQATTARERLLLAFAESDENRSGSPDVETLAEVAPGEWDFLTA